MEEGIRCALGLPAVACPLPCSPRAKGGGRVSTWWRPVDGRQGGSFCLVDEADGLAFLLEIVVLFPRGAPVELWWWAPLC